MNAIEFTGSTDVGLVRKNNEDTWFADSGLGLFIVSDGMGGQASGEVASRIVVTALPPLIKERLESSLDLTSPEAAAVLKKTVVDVSQQVLDETRGRPQLTGMGATVVLVLIRERQALIGHLGDSRAYLFRDGILIPVTRDHSMVQILIDIGEITIEEAEQHPARSRLTQAVGMAGEVLPEARALILAPGDTLLLCSDGLSSQISGLQIAQTLATTPDLEKACQDLIAASNAAGGRDNVTVVLVRIEK